MAISFYKKKIIYREDGVPYLVRRTLFSCDWFSVKIHHILISDYDCFHCHPWNFITLLLKGSYIEHSVKEIDNDDIAYIMGLGGEPLIEIPVKKKYSAGSILFRPAEFKHSLHIDKPVWSFVITFKKVRNWGFWTPEGFVPWWKYRGEGRCE